MLVDHCREWQVVFGPYVPQAAWRNLGEGRAHAGRIAEEESAHLVEQVGDKVQITIEVSVTIPEGASDQIVRTVTENSRALTFTNFGSEAELALGRTPFTVGNKQRA